MREGPPKNPGLDRREFITGLFGAAAGLMLNTPVAQALDKLFTQYGMPLPNLENREATREHFFRNKLMFEKALSNPEVLAILNTPIDHTLTAERFRAVEEVMSVLLRNWPTAYGRYVEHLPEYNPQEWFGFMPSQSVRVSTTEFDKSGNGTLLPNGQVLTAAHVVENTTTPHSRPANADLDIALFTPAEGNVGGARQPINPIQLTPAELRGKIVSIAGWDDPDAGQGHIEEFKKVYVTGILPISEAIGLYVYFHSAQKSNSSGVQKYKKLQAGERNQHFSESLRNLALIYKDFGNLVLLPHDETVNHPGSGSHSSGMSGSGLFIRDNPDSEVNVVGVYTHGMEVHDPIAKVCFSTAQCCTEIDKILSPGVIRVNN